jgi:phage-related protein
MPIGVVNYAQASEVLPWNLAASFARSETTEVQQNVYRGGEVQARRLVTNSRKAWEATFALTAVQLAELRQFYEDRQGPIEPFYFYDVTETEPVNTYDETGTAAAGRYTVRFDCDWEQQTKVGSLRGLVTIRLIQLAPPPE